MIYADSSFIVAALVENVDTPRADEFNAQEQRLPFTFLHWPEIARALWTNHQADAEAIWDELKTDINDGRTLYHARLDADTVARRAAGMMRGYAQRWPKLRSIDVMHVSAAVESRAKSFLSFDTNSFQRVLAHAQNLKVWPALTREETARLK